MAEARIAIDPGKLIKAIYDRGWSVISASRQIGRSDSYIRHKIRSQFVWQSDVKLFETELGIPLEEYMLLPTKVDEPADAEMIKDSYISKDIDGFYVQPLTTETPLSKEDKLAQRYVSDLKYIGEKLIERAEEFIGSCEDTTDISIWIRMSPEEYTTFEVGKTLIGVKKP